MRNNNNVKENKVFRHNYTLLDGLKVFFYAILLSVVVSIVVTIFLSLTSVIVGMDYGKFLNTRFVSYLMIVAMGLSYLILYFGYNKKNSIKNFSSLGLKNKVNWIYVAISVVLAIVCIFLFEPITSLILRGLEGLGFTVMDELTYTMDTWWRVILGIIGYALLPAVAEELVFRGVVQKGFETRFTAFCTIFLSTACFVIMHGSLQQFIYQIVLGVVLASFAYYTKNILYSIIFHFVNNLTVVVISLIGGPRYMEEGFFYISDFMGIFMPILLMLVGIGIIVLLVYFLRIQYKKQNNAQNVTVEGDNIIIEEENKKLSLKYLVTSLNLNEKFYFIIGWTSAIIIWVFNTFGYF